MVEKKHYYWIDLIRFLAAFLVMMAHYRGAFFVEYSLLPENQKGILSSTFYLLSRFGEEPVIVFFVLSGFLVGGVSFEKILNNSSNIKSYIIDRLVRIYLPLIASTIMVAFIIFYVEGSLSNKVIKDIFGSLFSFQGIFTDSTFNVVLWSLAYEVWFYVLMGCMMVLFKKDAPNKAIAFIILLICTYFLAKLKSIYLFTWLLGALAYFIHFKNNKYINLKTIALLGLFISSFLLSQFTSESRNTSLKNLNFLNREFSNLFIAFITCLLVNHIINLKPANKFSIKINSIGTKLANFSYSLYLTHYPLLALLAYFGFPKSNEINIRSIALYIVELCIGILVAYIIYLMSEKHTYKVKQYLKDKF